jgi:hypothetical protein
MPASPGNLRRTSTPYKCSACKIRLSAPLVIFQGAQSSAIYTRFSTFRIYIRLYSKIVQATNRGRSNSWERPSSTYKTRQGNHKGICIGLYLAVKLMSAQVTKLPLWHKASKRDLICFAKSGLTWDLHKVHRKEFNNANTTVCAIRTLDNGEDYS